jgi:hypothetical protein
MVTMLTSLNVPSKSSLAASYVGVFLLTEIIGPTLPSSNVIFVMFTCTLGVSSHSIQLYV